VYINTSETSPKVFCLLEDAQTMTKENEEAAMTAALHYEQIIRLVI
jgi:hypothetical protein